MPRSSGTRRVRSAAFAAAAVALTLGAHVTAHGEPPSLLLLLMLLTLVEAVASMFARRRRGPVATAAALLVSQVVLHFAFALGAPAHSVHTGHVLTLGMLIAHGIVAVALAALLSHGERLVAHVARALLPVAVLSPFRHVPVSTLAVVASSDVLLRRGTSLHDISGRGPPGRTVAART